MQGLSKRQRSEFDRNHARNGEGVVLVHDGSGRPELHGIFADSEQNPPSRERAMGTYG